MHTIIPMSRRADSSAHPRGSPDRGPQHPDGLRGSRSSRSPVARRDTRTACARASTASWVEHELEFVAHRDVVRTNRGDRRLEGQPGGIDRPEPDLAQAEAESLVEAQRVRVVVRRHDPDGSLDEARSERLDERRPGAPASDGSREARELDLAMTGVGAIEQEPYSLAI